MPKERRNKLDLYQMWIDSDPKFYSDLQIREFDLFCNVCDRFINSSTKYKVARHLNGHASSRAEDHDFFYELTEACVTSNIPLEKLNSTTFCQFLEKYMNRKIPHPSTLRKGYINKVYDDVVKKIREDVSNNFVYFIIDVVTDTCGHSVNFLIGALKSEGASDNHLLASKLLDKISQETVVNFVDECFNYVWPDQDNYSDKILVMLTDTATYMLKVADIVSQKYPYMIHFTCAVHGLNRVAEKIRDSFPLVDKLISNVKTFFVKAPAKRDFFKEILPGTPMPPEPVITRCDTWLQAVAYYDKYFEGIKSVIFSFDATESNSVKVLQELLKEESIREDIRYINSNYGILISAMKKLETRGLSLNKQFIILNDVQNKINNNNTGSVSVEIKETVIKVFERNPGFSILENICKFLNGTCPELPPDILKYSSCINKFLYCPLKMVDVERSFLFHKLILSDKRHSLTSENLEKLIVINFEHRSSHHGSYITH